MTDSERAAQRVGAGPRDARGPDGAAVVAGPRLGQGDAGGEQAPSLRKVTRKRGALPNPDSVRKVLYLAILKASEPTRYAYLIRRTRLT